MNIKKEEPTFLPIPLIYLPRVRRLGDGPDVRRLQTLGALGDVEFDALTLSESAEAFGLNRAVMAEDIVATIVLRNKTKALRVVEPLNSTSCHLLRSFFAGRPTLGAATFGQVGFQSTTD